MGRHEADQQPAGPQGISDAMNDLLWLHQHGAGQGVEMIIRERRQLVEDGPLPPDLNHAALLATAAGAYMAENDPVKSDAAEQLARAAAMEAAEIDILASS